MTTKLKSPKALAQEMFLLGSFDEHSLEDILIVLTAADDLYYNDDESFLEDSEYDALRLYAKGFDPTHVYFLGVGSEVRGGKVKLPYELGSLDQVYEGEITDWIGKWSLQQHFLIATDKLDGTSAMVIYDENGDLQIAFSRGDGTMGADITRIIKQFVPKNINRPMVVRGEVIIKKSNFPIVRDLVNSRSGKPYKNIRNMCAGVMNAKTNDPVVYEYLDFIAYEIIGQEKTKIDMLADLRDVGFNIPHSHSFLGHELTDFTLTRHLKDRRKRSEYEIDGLVLDVDAIIKRSEMNPTSETLNPAYSIKYKIADVDNQAVATVINIEWNISKSGYLKPRIQIEPIDLVGVNIQHCTGFNAKFIYDNKIGKGSTFQLVRSGDVIPFCQKVLTCTTPQMPEGHWEWNETEVDAVLVNPEDHEETIIQQCLEFFRSIDAPHLKEGTIRTMFDMHVYSDFTHATTMMLQYDEEHWVDCIGLNGKKIYAGLKEKMKDIPLYLLMGATPLFGRGVGVRKMKKLIKGLQVKTINELPLLNKAQIITVDGFEDKTAGKIVSGMDDFFIFMDGIINLQTIVEVGEILGSMSGEKILFTGFRSKEMQGQVVAEGGMMQSSISGKTTILVAKNPNSTSGKMKKAKGLGVRIMGIDEFKEMLTS